MKATKILLTIFLTALLIVVGFTTQILAITSITLINPWFYKTALRQLGVYEVVRTLLINQLEGFVDEQEAIPKDLKEEGYEIIENSFPKNRFARQIGDFFGDSINFFLYNEGDAEIPFETWIDDIIDEINDSKLVSDTEGMKRIFRITLTGYFKTFGNIFGDENTISGVFYKIIAPTDEVKEGIDSKLWVFRYWINLIHYVLYAGIALVLVLLFLLFVIWKRKIGTVFKIIGVISIFNSISFILISILLSAGITFGNLFNLIPIKYVSYIDIAKKAINPLAAIIFCIGLLLLAIGITLNIIGSTLNKRKVSKKEMKEHISSLNLEETLSADADSGIDITSEDTDI